MSGTYVGLKLEPVSATTLSSRCKELGLENSIPAKDLHVTLYYGDKAPLNKLQLNPSKIFQATVKDTEILGSGKWQALVLHLNSPALVRRHAAISALNPHSPHSYPTYTPHVSVKYKPESGDIGKIRSALRGMKITLMGEYSEPIKE